MLFILNIYVDNDSLSGLRNWLSCFNCFHNNMVCTVLLVTLSKHLFQRLWFFIIHVMGVRTNLSLWLLGNVGCSIGCVLGLGRSHLCVSFQRGGNWRWILIRVHHTREERRLHLCEVHLSRIHIWHEYRCLEWSPLWNWEAVHGIQRWCLCVSHLLHHALEWVLKVKVTWSVVNWHKNIIQLNVHSFSRFLLSSGRHLC